MPEHIQYDDHDLFNAETHHESSDVPVKGLLWFIVIFIVFSVITWAIVLFMYKGFAKMERDRMDPPTTAVYRPGSVDVPQNQPLLQPFPRKDENGKENLPQYDTEGVHLRQVRAAEEKVLTNYGWVDKEKGIVHIPIEEAKARFAAQAAVAAQTGVAPTVTSTAPMTTTAPSSSVPAPAGNPVPPDTGVAPSATTTTATTTHGGAHQ